MSNFPRNDGSAADSFALILNSDKLYGKQDIVIALWLFLKMRRHEYLSERGSKRRCMSACENWVWYACMRI